MSRPNSSVPEQPGLEVLSSHGIEVVPSSGLEVAPHDSAFVEHLAPEVVVSDKYYGAGEWYAPKAYSPIPPKQETPGLELAEQKKKSRRRLYVLIAIIVVVLIGAIVGGVVGGLQSRNNSGGSTNASSNNSVSSSAPNGTVTLQSLRPDSKLSVSGWRENDGFTIRLFYQDRKDNLRFSDYSTDEGSWSSSSKIATNDPMSGTPMGAAAIMQNDPPQYELFFLNSTSLLSGQNFRDGNTPAAGVWDSIDDYPVTVSNTSRMAMYWPYAVMQDEDDSLRLVTYLASSEGGPWKNQSLGISGLKSTTMAMIPQSSAYAFPYTAGIVYRTSDGNLAGYSVQWEVSGLAWDIGTPNTLPDETAIAAFAVARESDSINATNTYIVYQNTNNDIELLTNVNATWQVSPTVLTGADPGTDIACLTEALWENLNVLSSQYDMSRCYFMSGGQIREVLYNGTGWEELGNIPLT